MAEKTMDEIKRAFGSGVAAAINRYRDDLDKISGAPDSAYQVHVPHFVADDVQRRQLIQGAKQDAAKSAAKSARERAEKALERYPQEVARRRQQLQKSIFGGMEDAASAQTLSRVASASEEELERHASAALDTGNRTLVSGVFGEAVRRDLPHLRQRVAQEAGDVYQEWEATPSDAEVLEKVREQRFILDSSVQVPEGQDLYPSLVR